MNSLRVRRALWVLLVVLAGGTALFYMTRQLANTAPGVLDGFAAALSQGREFLRHYGFWLHLCAHGATYLYLVLRWQRLVHWIDRRRALRGYPPLPAIEQRRLAWAVITVCSAYESLLMLRYLG